MRAVLRSLPWVLASVAACGGTRRAPVGERVPLAEPPSGHGRLEQVVIHRLDLRSPPRPEAAIVVGLVAGGATVVAGRGRTAPNVLSPPDGETLFLVGSVTKVFTGLLLADAVSSGLLGPDTPVQQLLPEVPIPTTKDGFSPTLIQLATHTSGLPEMFANWTPNGQELMDLLRACTLSNRPGEKAVYSNIGYSLLGDAVARAWGLDYAEALQARVTRPLGMTRTAYMWTGERSRRAQGYDGNWNPVADSVNVPTLAPCCVLESTADDLLRLVHAYVDAAPVGMQSALALAAEPVLQGNDSLDASLLGMGWFISLPDGRLCKDGLMQGYRATVRIDRSTREGVVVLANQTEIDTGRIADEVLRDLAVGVGAGSPPCTVESLPGSARVANVVFEGGLRLIGYNAPTRVPRGDALPVTFYFKTDTPISEDFRISVSGESAGSRHRIHGDHYPATNTQLWPVGRIVTDTTRIPIPADTDYGMRTFYVGFASGARQLPIVQGCAERNRACGPSVRVE